MISEWETVGWGEGVVRMLDQRLLPREVKVLELATVEEVAHAIEDLVVRGAPAIGIAAAFGVALAAQLSDAETAGALAEELEPAFVRLSETRPTAKNLFWALERMRGTIDPTLSADGLKAHLLAEAQAVLEEDIATCRAIGDQGASLVPEGAGVLTHCNAGALATGGWGTALGVLRSAWALGTRFQVYADETRPVLQGARLTAWELQRDGLPVTVLTDNAAAQWMARGKVDLVIVGADRIAANGDVANKIGTYGLGVLARAHDIPLYVAAPMSTVDPEISSGAEIPIEERGRDEVVAAGGEAFVPDAVPVLNPAFDVTPAELVTAIITEHAVVRPPYRF
jgi:methylthioribose-1-phosphate isomerase